MSACVAIGPPLSPTGALEAYAEALARGDADGAYALLTPTDQRATSRTALAAELSASRREAQELARRLRRAERPRLIALVTLDDGSELRLERDPHGYRLVDPLTRLYGQASPRQALLSFIRAVEHERWDVVLCLMPDAARAGLDAARLGAQLETRREELSRLVALLATARENPIEVVGDRATMPYAESYTARFVRERGAWKVEDPE